MDGESDVTTIGNEVHFFEPIDSRGGRVGETHAKTRLLHYQVIETPLNFVAYIARPDR